MLVIADGFRRLNLLFLPWFHFLISGKLTGIDLVQIWIALVPKGTGSVPQSMGKRNWSRSKRNWEIPISDQNRSAFILDCLKYFHHLILHLLKSKTKLHNQHKVEIYKLLTIDYRIFFYVLKNKVPTNSYFFLKYKILLWYLTSEKFI